MIINDKRALAYIVTVDEVKPIPNYDRVEYARTNGWWCVTKLNELKVGDKVVLIRQSGGQYYYVADRLPKE